jgi:hypothetical protein
MASDKIQVGKALQINPSDTADIPNPSYNGRISGTASAVTANNLVDSTADFVADGVKVGDIVYNNTDRKAATVTTIVSGTQLTLSEDIFDTISDAYVVYLAPDISNQGCVFYVGVGGDVTVRTVGGDQVTFQNLNNGQFVPVEILQVLETGTTATGLVALW